MLLLSHVRLLRRASGRNAGGGELPLVTHGEVIDSVLVDLVRFDTFTLFILVIFQESLVTCASLCTLMLVASDWSQDGRSTTSPSFFLPLQTDTVQWFIQSVLLNKQTNTVRVQAINQPRCAA